MQTFLRDCKEEQTVTLVVLTNYMHQGSGSEHGGLDVLASGEEKKGDVDGGDDGEGGVYDGVATTGDRPGGPSVGGGVSGTSHDDGVQSAGADPVTNPTTTVTVSAPDGNVGGPDGARVTGAPPHVTPPRHPPLWSMSPTSSPGFFSTPQQQRGVHAVQPDSV